MQYRIDSIDTQVIVDRFLVKLPVLLHWWWMWLPHTLSKCLPSFLWGAELMNTITLYILLSMTDQGQSSHTIVALCPTKAQSQSCLGSCNPTKFTPTLHGWQFWLPHILSKFLPSSCPMQIWGEDPPFIYVLNLYLSDQDKSSGAIVVIYPIKPQS